MLKREHRTSDERLAEFVAEVARTIGGLDQNLLRGLIQPLAHWQQFFPATQTALMVAGIAGHIHCGSGDRPGTYTTTHSVADLTTRTGGSAVERLNCGWEVMGLGLQGDDRFYIFHLEIVARGMVLRSKLLHHRALRERHIVLISRQNLVWILLSGLLNHLEERRFFLLSVDDEGATENLVTAMLRVDLGETEHFRVSQLTPQLTFHIVEVCDFLRTQRQSFLLIVFFQVLNVKNWGRSDFDGEYILVQTAVHTLKHGVVVGIFIRNREIFLDSLHPIDGHVLRDFHGVRTPWSHHLTARSDKKATESFCVQTFGIAVKPAQLLSLLFIHWMIQTRGDYTL